MIYISHRGNLYGPDPDRDNNPKAIDDVLKKGFDVEVDVWEMNGCLYLGHDFPQFYVEKEFLTNPSIWCHAKNYKAIGTLSEIGAHYFWHEGRDIMTLTSFGFMWALADTEIPPPHTIAVMPEDYAMYSSKPFAGICSDYIVSYYFE